MSKEKGEVMRGSRGGSNGERWGQDEMKGKYGDDCQGNRSQTHHGRGRKEGEEGSGQCCAGEADKETIKKENVA